MSDQIDAGAPAADASVQPESQPSAPRALEPTPRAALERAFAKVEAEDAEASGAPRPVESQTKEAPEPAPAKETPAQTRAADGKFAPKEGEKAPPVATKVEPGKKDAAAPVAAPAVKPDPSEEPPSRFSTDAKAAWKEANPAIRGEVQRAIKELETGLSQYKERAENFKDLDEYAGLAKQHNTSIKAALDRYTALERTLRSDNYMAAMEEFSRYSGKSLRHIAEQVLNRTPDQHQAQYERVVGELRQKIASLESNIGQVTSTIHTQTQTSAEQHIQNFFTSHPDAESIAQDMGFFMLHNRAGTIEEAYQMAKRLNTDFEQAAPVPAEQTAPPAQTRKGNLSITGAPGPGSNPANRKPPASAREALANAFAQLGIG